MEISKKSLGRCVVLGLTVLAGFAVAPGGVGSSNGQGLPGQLPTASQANDPAHQKNRDDPALPNDIVAKQGRARNDERQRRLVADTDKLLALATSLHDDVAKTNKDVMSLDVIKRAEEIEKLARSVKERMKG